MGRNEFDKMTPEEIREHCRMLHRSEQDLPKVKWAAFQEQRRHEDLAAIKFQAKQGEISRKFKNPNPQVERFIGRLRRRLAQRMKEQGGTEQSVIRQCFLNWDADCSGELSTDEFVKAMHSLGMTVTKQDADTVVGYYDLEGDGEMCYQPLIEDVARGQRHFLEHPAPELAAAEEATSIVTPKYAARHMTPFIRLFLKKLKGKLHAHMKQKGEYERILIRKAFLNWDADSSGKLNEQEFIGAMKQVGISLGMDDARKVVGYYDFDNSGEMVYQPLVDDVTAGAPHFLHHPESQSSRVAKDPDFHLLNKMFTVRQRETQQNVVVEQFKIKLRNRLEEHVKSVGGSIESILREAFLFWDADSSGELNVDEFRGAMSRVGLHITKDEANQVVRYYDREGTHGRYGDMEIDYTDLVRDVTKGAQHFLAHPQSGRMGDGVDSVRMPDDVKDYLHRIKIAAARRHRHASRHASGGSTPGARDMLHGTLLRFDKGSTGRLGKDNLIAALKELDVKISENEVGRLIWWYDQDASDMVIYNKVVDDAFAGENGAMTQLTASGRNAASRSAPNGGMRGSSSLPMVGTAEMTARSTARSKRASIMAEKARIERRLKELQKKDPTATI